MRRFAAALLLFLAACRTAAPAKPEIVIELLASEAAASHYRIRMRNAADEPVTLRRVEFMREGDDATLAIDGYDVTIKPGRTGSVELWGAPAYDGVTLRALCLFDSPSGQLQTVVTQRLRVGP